MNCVQGMPFCHARNSLNGDGPQRSDRMEKDRRGSMRIRIAFFAAAAFCLGCTDRAAAQKPEPVVPDRLMVTINTQQTAEPVSKYEFGMRSEERRVGKECRSRWSPD